MTPSPMEDVIALLEQQVKAYGSLTLDREQAEQLIRVLRAQEVVAEKGRVLAALSREIVAEAEGRGGSDE